MDWDDGLVHVYECLFFFFFTIMSFLYHVLNTAFLASVSPPYANLMAQQQRVY